MTYTILGKRPVSFTASDGRTITGTSLYVGCEAAGVEGLACEKLFISAEKMPKAEIVVGKDADIFFTRYGKVEKIVPIA